MGRSRGNSSIQRSKAAGACTGNEFFGAHLRLADPSHSSATDQYDRDQLRVLPVVTPGAAENLTASYWATA